ncbi:MAG: rhomboid family intramembrane serine protease [Ruminococcaceae bacterium]|nr:rhomboid family intramembrane serine protease [Oscillospiraceae bacterium]
MKWFSRKVDLFCYKHPRFGISNLMLYVVIGNVIVWLFGMMDTAGTFINLLSFSPAHILRGQVWRLLTFALIPNSWGFLALIFFYFYYFIGKTLEDKWGTARFNIYFFTGMLLTVIYGFILYFITGVSYSVTAYYIYLSMFFSFAALFPNLQVLLFFIIPIKMKWLAIVDAIIFIVDIIQLPFPVNLLPLVAVLNFLIFCGDELFSYIRPRRRSQRKAAVNFKREVQRINYEKKTKAYTRRCEVCGRTDTDYPELEFRYCSRCAGYHCFCIDHINAHQHFTE